MKQEPKQHLVVVIPALNEAKTIEGVIKKIPSQIPGIATIQVVVINDGSTDQTAKLAAQAGADVMSHQTPKGVGAAFHRGIRRALELGADIIVNIDADGQFNPTDIPQLITPIQNNSADFVTATRFAVPERIPTMPAIKIWGNKNVVRMVNLITGKKFTDVSCGFRAYSREAALRMTLFGSFTYTQETFIDLAFKNMRIVEIPLMVRGEREHGTSRVASNLWHYALKSGSIMLRAGRDYKPFYFFGIPGLTSLVIGLIIGIFLVIHFILTGHTSPYRAFINVSTVFIITGLLLTFISMLADMIHRNRILIEEQLYLSRKHAYAQAKAETEDRH